MSSDEDQKVVIGDPQVAYQKSQNVQKNIISRKFPQNCRNIKCSSLHFDNTKRNFFIVIVFVFVTHVDRKYDDVIVVVDECKKICRKSIFSVLS